MKKTIYRTLSLVIIVSVLFTSTAFAGGAIHAPDKSLRLYSQVCPEEAAAYAEGVFDRMLRASVEGGSIVINGTVQLGTPFTIFGEEAPTYYFPVIFEDVIIATFRVYVDELLSREKGRETYTGILSPYLSEELNVLSEAIDTVESVCLLYDNGNLMVQVEDKVSMLLPNMTGNQPSGISIDIRKEPLRAATLTNITATTTVPQMQSQPTSTKYLNLDLIETQGSNSWCAAYVTAAIIRYLNSTSYPNAYSLMVLMYGQYGFTTSTPFTPNNVMDAARVYGYSPIFCYDTQSLSDVFISIDNNKPIYAGMDRYDASGQVAGGHAVAIRGYSQNTDTLSVWNPHYAYYETMDMYTLQYRERGLTYTWVRGIYF